MLAFWLVQDLAHEFFRVTVDYLRPLTGETQRMFRSDEITNLILMRPAGLFNEPGTYGTFQIFLCCALLSFKRTGLNAWVAAAAMTSVLFSFACLPYLIGGLLMAVLVQANWHDRKLMTFILTILLVPCVLSANTRLGLREVLNRWSHFSSDGSAQSRISGTIAKLPDPVSVAPAAPAPVPSPQIAAEPEKKPAPAVPPSAQSSGNRGEVGLRVLQKVFGWGLGNLSVDNSYVTGLLFANAYLGPVLTFVIIGALLWQAPSWAFVLLLAQALLGAPYIQQPIFWLCAAAVHSSIPDVRKHGLMGRRTRTHWVMGTVQGHGRSDETSLQASEMTSSGPLLERALPAPKS